MDSIVVIGAGVTGLTTALMLKQMGYPKVVVVAKHIPGDMCIEYTSPYAGAHWRSLASNEDKILQGLETYSYKMFLNLAEQNAENNGIMVVPSYDYYDNNSAPESTNPWFRNTVRNFKFLTEKDGLPKGAKIGHNYTTVLINSPIYLNWLRSNFEKLGGKIVQRAISHIDQVADFVGTDQFAAINCTGLGARFMGGVHDDAVFPTRGQTVVVNAPHIKKTITHLGAQGINYVIPRSDGTVVLGGTANKKDFNPFPDDPTTESILKRTTALCPELIVDNRPLDIVRVAVGLRPSREGGPRFENEIIKSRDGKSTFQVTHAYGHGGFGYQTSWGSAKYAIQIMEEGITSANKKMSSRL